MESAQPTSAALLAGRYRLGARLGAGSGGVVFSARDERLTRDVAVKVVQTPAATDHRAFDRLVREAHAAARTGHPNIVQILDLGRTDDGHPFIVMERLRGETLEERVRRVGALDVALARDVHAQLLDALAAAHGAGVLHRDVKPSNVFLTELANGGVLVKLLDFGLAALLDAASAKLSDTGSVLGSPAYLAPERWLGRAADARTDVYAVGVCLFESLVGRPPFEAPSVTALRGRVVASPPPSLRDARADADADLSDVVRRALAKDPAERFDAATMRDALLRRAPTREAPDAPRVRPTQPRRGPALAVGIALVIVAVAVSAYLAARPSGGARAMHVAPGHVRIAAAEPPRVEHVAPPPSVAAVAPPPSVDHVAPPPSVDHVAPPPSVDHAAPPSHGVARGPRERAAPRPAATRGDAPPATRSGHDARVGESILDPF